jgi:hypothetical protein
MSNRDKPVHVASIKCTRRDKVYQTHLLRRTYRDGNKVKHQTLGNISHLPPHIIDVIKGALRGETYVPTSAAFPMDMWLRYWAPYVGSIWSAC